METTLYNNEQRIFALNFMSNLASLKRGDQKNRQQFLETTLHNLLTSDDIIGMIGKWELVWGPVVVEEGIDKKTKYSTNAMYVAKSSDGEQYVIAIAGTNALSLYGWFDEDFKTGKMVNWNAADTTKGNTAARIAEGTNDGLNILLNMRWIPPAAKKSILSWRNKSVDPNTGITLNDFLENEFGAENYSEKKQVIVTGHSLGGTLATVMAMRLFEWQTQVINPMQQNQKPWNPSHSVTLTAMPVANASPGNKMFSDYYGNKIGTRTLRVWNRMDPVPYGHQPDMLQALPHLYYPYIVPDIALYATVNAMLASSYAGTGLNPHAGGYYTQIIPQCGPLAGQYNGNFPRINPAKILQAVIDNFVSRILHELGVNDTVIALIIGIINELLKKTQWVSFVTLPDLLHKNLGAHLPGAKLLKEFISAITKAVQHLSKVFAFLQQLGYQHVWAYFQLLNMPQIIPFLKSVLHGGTKTEEEEFEDLLNASQDSMKNFWDRLLTPQFIRENYLD